MDHFQNTIRRNHLGPGFTILIPLLFFLFSGCQKNPSETTASFYIDQDHDFIEWSLGDEIQPIIRHFYTYRQLNTYTYSSRKSLAELRYEIEYRKDLRGKLSWLEWDVEFRDSQAGNRFAADLINILSRKYGKPNPVNAVEMKWNQCREGLGKVNITLETDRKNWLVYRISKPAYAAKNNDC